MSKKSSFAGKVAATLDVLVGKYPNAIFPKDSTETKPLRIGVYTLLTGQNPEIGRATIAGFLRSYTKKDRYLRALTICADRVDLSGNPFEPVAKSHGVEAARILLEREQDRMKKAA